MNYKLSSPLDQQANQPLCMFLFYSSPVSLTSSAGPPAQLGALSSDHPARPLWCQDIRDGGQGLRTCAPTDGTVAPPWDLSRWNKERQVTWELHPAPLGPRTAWDTACLCAALGITVASAAQCELPPLEQDKCWLNCIPERGQQSQTAT